MAKSLESGRQETLVFAEAVVAEAIEVNEVREDGTTDKRLDIIVNNPNYSTMFYIALTEIMFEQGLLG